MENKAIWNKICKKIEEKIGRPDFESWIKPLQFFETKDNTVFLKAPSRFVRDWIESNFVHEILKCFQEIFPDLDIQKIEIENQIFTSKTTDVVEKAEREDDFSSPLRSETNLDPRFTFKNFVVGKSNEFAYAAALRVAESDKVLFNPLFLYGGGGFRKNTFDECDLVENKRNFS